MTRNLDDILSRCLQGCPNAWRILFEDHAPVVYHVLREMGAAHEAAEDVVGDTFLRLIENRAECLSRACFNNERQFRRWLIVSARHRYLDVHRHDQAVRAVAVDEDVEWEIFESAGTDDHEEAILRGIDARAEAEQAMACVSPREQLIIRLFYSSDMPLKEISALIGVPVGAVSATLSRARDKMRHTMQENGQLDRSVNGRTAVESAQGLAVVD